MQELWLPIPSYEGLYEISNLGNVKSLSRTDLSNRQRPEKIIGLINKHNGYKVVTLTKGHLKKQLAVHRLVLLIFIGKCPENMEACHNDGNKANCSLENLRYDTHANNNRDKIKHKTIPKGSSHHMNKIPESDIASIFYDKRPIKDLAQLYNVLPCSINAIKKRRNWRWITDQLP